MNTSLYKTILLTILMLSGGLVVYAQTSSQSPSPTYTSPPSPSPDSVPLTTPYPIPGPEEIKELLRPRIVQQLSLVSTPASPSPGETLSIQAQTPTFDKNASQFIWTVDGKSRPDLSGFGKNTFNLLAGDLGSVIRVSVEVIPPGQASIRATQTIYVSDLTLTWTTGTYIPKWYKGKALPVANSDLRIAAIPTIIIDGVTIPANKLIFTWNMNGKRATQGVGSQVFEYKAPERSFNTQLIRLVVEDVNKKILKEARIAISNREPRAAIYQVFPLGGIEFRRATAAFSPVSTGSLDLQIEPFFFNVTSRKYLAYDWSAEGKQATGVAENPFFLTLDIQERQLGNIPVSIFVNDTDMFVPSAYKTLTIPFTP
ncbi:MAG: hypothetical protein U1A25_02570 [Candidatus Sungbacteria bacterium]|nr:hypothetical protein [bacterium]MDZ4260525.1 hypothetical protein [Candidatus Sungbacteria bacterium]